MRWHLSCHKAGPLKFSGAVFTFTIQEVLRCLAASYTAAAAASVIRPLSSFFAAAAAL